jgi:hypothetical protein
LTSAGSRDPDVVVTVTRSAGSTAPCGPGLRVLVNDDPAWAGVAYRPVRPAADPVDAPSCPAGVVLDELTPAADATGVSLPPTPGPRPPPGGRNHPGRTHLQPGETDIRPALKEHALMLDTCNLHLAVHAAPSEQHQAILTVINAYELGQDGASCSSRDGSTGLEPAVQSTDSQGWLATPASSPPSRVGPMVELLRIVITDGDVDDLTEELGVDPDLAMDRAQAWLKAIGETASTLINQQLASVIQHDTP